jgi:hypothetical protein
VKLKVVAEFTYKKKKEKRKKKKEKRKKVVAEATRQGTELRRFGSPKEIWRWDQVFLFCA